MFSSKFQEAFVDCLQRQRNFYLIFKDSYSSEMDEMVLAMDSIAPQYSVSTIHLDVSVESCSISNIAELLTKRAKKVMSALSFSDQIGDLEKIAFATKVLEDSLLVIHNADRIAKGELIQLQQLCMQINSMGIARLRVSAIGDMSLVHNSLRDQLKFINVKFYNLMEDKDEMDAVLSRVTDMTVGRLWGGEETHVGFNAESPDDSAAPFIYFGKQV